ncbi:MAG: DNA-binding protein YbiB [Rubrivivax sp.]|nr:DNA-binding protein YbiB [Rubrivivax sp.]
MTITNYLKVIGRGKAGARALDAAQAEDLLRQVFDGQVNDVQLGAFLIAMRIKGESPQELAGFLAAVQARYAPAIARALQSATRPTVWLPSYNGARKLPNLTALLAGLLARQGLSVIVHGPAVDPLRVTSHAVFAALGWTIVEAEQDAASIDQAWSAQRPVFITTDALCPPLARLLAQRWQVGLRSAGHTVAKLLTPTPSQRALRVVNHTHPEYGAALAQFLTDTRADALLLRGTEGEPVADARRTPRMDAFVAGQRIDALSVPAQGGVLARVPQLPAAIDAPTTASFIDAALADPDTVPRPLQAQVNAIAALSQRIAQPLERAA